MVCNPLWVDKSSGEKRTCINYRPVNAVTKIWEWPLPKIREIRHQIRDGKWFSKLDLKEAFHRIEVDRASRPLTAFATPWGAYQFTRMPFGLATAPATYQRFLDWVLHGLKERVINYVDDILIWGRTRKECLRWEWAVRRRLKQHHVEVNEAKSLSCQKELVFVGLRIADGTVGCALKMDGWAPPVTKQDWQSFLGYANCYRDYLPNLSTMTAGLYPGTNQLPTSERVTKARALYEALTQATSLNHFSDTTPANAGFGIVPHHDTRKPQNHGTH